MVMLCNVPMGRNLPVPGDLPGATRKARALLDAHKAARPSNSDIPALTAWSEEKEFLVGQLTYLENSARMVWRPVNPASLPVPVQPPPAVERPVRKPSSRGTGTPRKTPQARLDGMAAKESRLLEDMRSAPDGRAFAAVRQQIFTLRNDAKHVAKAAGMPVPAFVTLPPNPFAAGRSK